MSAILLNRAHNPIQHVERSRIEVRLPTGKRFCADQVPCESG